MLNISKALLFLNLIEYLAYLMTDYFPYSMNEVMQVIIWERLSSSMFIVQKKKKQKYNVLLLEITINITHTTITLSSFLFTCRLFLMICINQTMNLCLLYILVVSSKKVLVSLYNMKPLLFEAKEFNQSSEKDCRHYNSNVTDGM